MYINCKTYFSLHYGTFSTEELVRAGVEAGATAMALTNINTTSDAWDFLSYCQEQHIKPVLGAEIRNGHQLLYILLAKNNKGFQWINEFLSEHLLAKKSFPEAAGRTAGGTAGGMAGGTVGGTAGEMAGGTAFFSDPADGVVIYPLSV